MRRLVLLLIILTGIVLVQGCTHVDLRNPVSGKRYQMCATYGQKIDLDCNDNQ